ncbi:hypothetical protein BDN72DRAFT_964291 [Pluteus cervinus]|uniref:Uncharacterized protein n=1 Tax=Pluteus cervinus TaxID=181527 RepID=A0ACD3AB65_9AGAR|nr:hypothetical protein BDN72DRAFT_964291 [Pluteus cervinus]
MAALTLPSELEYEIFALAYQNEESHPVNLLLVAKRVHDWLIPRIYEVVLFRTYVTRPRSASSPSTLKMCGHHTRHLLFRISTPPISTIELLSYCPNVENIAVWSGYTQSRDLISGPETPLTSLRLKRLSIHVAALAELDQETRGGAESDTNTGTQIQKHIEVFLSTITHLDIASRVCSKQELSALSYCPSLTHLCLFETLPLETLRWVFDVCAKLEVVVWLEPKLVEIEGIDVSSVAAVVSNRPCKPG